MAFATTILFYMVFGIGVAAAIFIRGDGHTAGERWFRVLTALFFWPLHLPLLLDLAPREPRDDARTSAPTGPPNSLTRAIEQVESELDAALGSLDGWAEGVLADEHQRLHELRAAWRAQAERINELERLLAQPDFAVSESAAVLGAGEAGFPIERRFQSDRGRTENIRRLHEMRRRMRDDLLGTLAWVRELVTMIHLAKFSGAPASRAEELVSQIAAAVEGLREASTWHDAERELVAAESGEPGS